ncbi:LysR substrate-binding domain-containing protein [Sorangium sp. So ce327]|uniref:LysR substrate-binding domain-containing protein n=1 Tax=Sorangium sp. So ce327 TaxID=3133301 RepID=UPI003F60EB92
MALLPDHIAAADLRAGKLVRVFPEWYVTEGIVHIVFTSRRGLPPSVRALIEHLASHIHDDVMKDGIDRGCCRPELPSSLDRSLRR